MSKPPPYFPFYPTDFASSGKVEVMTTEEIGAYILLLGKAWHESPPCSIPNDDRILARWTRLGDERWALARAAVLACFDRRADGRLYQSRLDREWRAMVEYRNRQSENGKKGGRESAKRRFGGASSDGEASLNLPSSSSSSSSDLPLPPAGVRAATTIDRIQAMLGRDLSSSDRLTITRAEDKYGHMGTLEIHGQHVGYIDLFDRAVGVAIAEPHFEWRSAGAFTRYIAAIVQRAVDERVWPGERPEPVGVGVGTPAMPPVSKAEQEAVERAWAKQQAKEAKR